MHEKILPHSRHKNPLALSSCHLSLINSINATNGCTVAMQKEKGLKATVSEMNHLL